MMTWMLYLLAVALLVALGALALERSLRATGRPGRWVWLGAMALSLAIPGWALLQGGWVTEGSPGPAEITFLVEHGAELSVTPQFEEASSVGLVSGIRDSAATFLSLRAARINAVDPLPRWGWLTLWGLLSTGLALFFLMGARRLAGERKRWPLEAVAGRRVHISTREGPAVVGVRAPAIVLPRWLLALPPSSVDTVLLHEESHARVRDTLVLALGVGMVLAAPWNPVLWYQFRRLRRAVELDCDARVLAQGVPPKEYGKILLEVGERASRPALPAAALLEDPRLLETRLGHLRPGAARLSRLAVVGCVALAGVALAAACGSPSPSQVAAPDAPESPAEGVGGPSPSSGSDFTPTLTLGELEFRGPARLREQWEQDVAQRIAAINRLYRERAALYREELAEQDRLREEIEERMDELMGLLGSARIHPTGSTDPTTLVPTPEAAAETEARISPPLERAETELPTPFVNTELPLMREDADDRAAPSGTTRNIRLPFLQDDSTLPEVATDTVTTIRVRSSQSMSLESGNTPLLLVNGEIVEAGLSDIVPEDIERVEVIRGPAALDRWGERARHGAILITLKGGVR